MPHFLAFSLYLLAADIIFLLRFERRGRFLIRALCSAAMIFGAMALLEGNDSTLPQSMVTYLITFLLTAFAGIVCFDITWPDSVFCATAGYSVQHIASILRRGIKELTHVLGYQQSDILVSLLGLTVTLLFYWCIYHVFGRQIIPGQELVQKKRLLPVVVLAVMVEILLFDIVVVRMVRYPEYDSVYIGVICATNIIYGIAILIIQFGLILQQSLESELTVVQQMLEKERQQYQISKDTISLINQKCHDMKHQIRQIGRTRIGPKALQEMEDVIGVYDSMLKTGNQALDVLLAEKALFCQSNQVEVTCIADGSALSFMNDSDIYALFGNMLDNAIQATMEMIPDSRAIGVIVKKEAGFVSISSYNYHQGQVVMEKGMPVTTHPDKDYHGFGIKSMAMIVEKYGGTIDFRTDGNIFHVNILLPIVQREDSPIRL